MPSLCEYRGSSISQEDWDAALELAQRWKNEDSAYGNPGKSLALLAKAFLHLKVCYDEHVKLHADEPALPPEAKAYDLQDLDVHCQLAASAAIQAALNAIDEEPEVPGAMPDAMWAAINGDRDACENAIRIAVRQTKDGIRERFLRSTPQKDSS